MLGPFLRSLRKSKGLNQTEAGAQIGISKNQVLLIEHKEEPYGYGGLKKYATGIGYDVEIHFINQEDRGDVRVYKGK